MSAGEVLQRQRDKRNDMYAGRRGTQAAVDTVKAYLPASLERPANLIEAAAAEAASRGATLRDPRINTPTGRVTVDLSPGFREGHRRRSSGSTARYPAD